MRKVCGQTKFRGNIDWKILDCEIQMEKKSLHLTIPPYWDSMRWTNYLALQLLAANQIFTGVILSTYNITKCLHMIYRFECKHWTRKGCSAIPCCKKHACWKRSESASCLSPSIAVRKQHLFKVQQKKNGTCSEAGIPRRCSNRCSGFFCNLKEAPKQLVPSEEEWNAFPFSHEAIQRVQDAAALGDGCAASKTTDLENIWWRASQYFISLAAGLWKTSTRACVSPQWGSKEETMWKGGGRW